MVDATNNELPFEDDKDMSGLMGLALDDKLQPGADPGSGGERFVAPPPAELAQHFPSLEILERIGTGGMGCVYKARQRHLDRLVALKILPQELGRDARFAERFTREARALARLVHPHIVTIHDFGQVDGMYFLVMEYMDGMSLRELMEVDQPEMADVVDIITRTCRAIEYAHEAGIVHRDIKPENILFDKRGHVKIADFGLVKLAEAHDVSLTGSRQAMGTLHYMAPEQWERPQDVDHRADLYALGVMLYEMITGRLPLGRFEAPSNLVASDPKLDAIVMRAMQSDPDQRYGSAAELAADLAQVEVPRLAQNQMPAGHQGTFTMFVNTGGRMKQFAQRVAAGAEQQRTGFPWGVLVCFVGVLLLSFGSWQGHRDAFSTAIEGMPVRMDNFLPLIAAGGLLALSLFRERLRTRGDLLSILLGAYGIVHIVFFYTAHSWEPNSREELTLLPGIVGLLFALLVLDRIWAIIVRMCSSVAEGARSLPWKRWVDGLQSRSATKRDEAERRQKQKEEKTKRVKLMVDRQLAKVGIGPFFFGSDEALREVDAALDEVEDVLK